MNRKQLKIKLDELEINPNDYSLDGTLLPMRTILFFQKPNWYTFDYDERGRVLDEREFETENEACDSLLNRLVELKEFREKYGIK